MGKTAAEIGGETLTYPTKKRMLKDVGRMILDKTDAAMTLRQLYYRFVALDILDNKTSQYKYLSEAIKEARVDGEIPWDAIEDRTRSTDGGDHSYIGPEQRFKRAFKWFKETSDRHYYPRWTGQDAYVEAWCFPPETPVTTPSGPRRIDSISEGDEVIGEAGEPERVVETMERQYEGELVEIDTRSNGTVRTTPNHRVLCVKSKRSKGRETNLFEREKEWAPAGELSERDVLVVPRPMTDDATPPRIEIGVGESQRTPEERKSLLWILGLYVAEGSIHTDGRTVKWTTGAERPVDRIYDHFAGCGHKVQVYENGEREIVYDVKISNADMARALSEMFGDGAENKRLPGWVFELSDAEKRALLDGMIYGDGTVETGGSSKVSLSSVSKALIKQTRMLFHQLGYRANFYKHYSAGDNPKANHDCYQTALGGDDAREWMGDGERCGSNSTWMDDSFLYTPVRSADRVEYIGKVHNFETEETHTYCVPFVVHNCEKAALGGIFADVCDPLKVRSFPNRGYTSITMLKQAADRFKEYSDKECKILYFGDYDPSGQDIERNIREKLVNTFGVDVTVERKALNREQIDRYELPPQPAKTTDARYEQFVEEHGDIAVELDALPPESLKDLIRDSVNEHFDMEHYKSEVLPKQRAEREEIQRMMDDLLGE